MAACPVRFYNSVMKKLLWVLCGSLVLLLAPLFGEPHEWTNAQGKTIKAEFVSATNESVTISMQGKTFVVKLADLSPQSRALAAKLRVQKSTAQKLVTKVEVPKIVVDVDELKLRNGLAYFEGKPFTGVAVGKYPNGQKNSEATFKEGEQHGLETTWYSNGQKEYEAIFEDGKKDGLKTVWRKNGQKKEESTYKDGNLVTATVWKPNGLKCPDTNLVDGNGISCSYHENGQKRYETTYKDSERISSKGWDEAGKPE